MSEPTQILQKWGSNSEWVILQHLVGPNDQSIPDFVVRVQGRCRDQRARFVGVVVETNIHPVLQINSPDEPGIWFDLDLEELQNSRGHLCCYPTVPQPELSSDAVLWMREEVEANPDCVLLPPMGTCQYKIQQTAGGPDRSYRIDCLCHLPSWLEVSIDGE